MPISNRELKKSKDLVEKLLKVNGEKYNDWLYQIHQQYIEENQSLILDALSAFTDDPKPSQPKENKSQNLSNDDHQINKTEEGV